MDLCREVNQTCLKRLRRKHKKPTILTCRSIQSRKCLISSSRAAALGRWAPTFLCSAPCTRSMILNQASVVFENATEPATKLTRQMRQGSLGLHLPRKGRHLKSTGRDKLRQAPIRSHARQIAGARSAAPDNHKTSSHFPGFLSAHARGPIWTNSANRKLERQKRHDEKP